MVTEFCSLLFYVLFWGVEHFMFVTAGVDECGDTDRDWILKCWRGEAEVGDQNEMLLRFDCLYSGGVDSGGMAVALLLNRSPLEYYSLKYLVGWHSSNLIQFPFVGCNDKVEQDFKEFIWENVTNYSKTHINSRKVKKEVRSSFCFWWNIGRWQQLSVAPTGRPYGKDGSPFNTNKLGMILV